MKKIYIVALLTSLVGMAAVGCKKESQVKMLADQRDSISYVMGMNAGRALFAMDSTLNVDVLCEALRDGYEGHTLLTQEQAEAFYLRYMNYALPEIVKSHESRFLDDVTDNSYRATKSGLRYKVTLDGDGKVSPQSDRDSVVMRYKMLSRGGDVVYSSFERGDKTTMAMGELVSGMKEGLKLIGKGGKVSLWIPSSLGYGTEGNPELGVAANETLYCEIELVDIKSR